MARQVPSNTPDLEGRLWTARETAAYLSVPVATLYRWRYDGSGPRAFRVGKHLRYDRAEVRRWLEAKAR